MGSIPVAGSSPLRRRRPPILAALLAAFVAAVLTLVAVAVWPHGGPAGTVVGRVDEFTPGQPVHLEDHAVWVVRGIEDRFFAFSDDDPRVAGQHDCRVEWNPGRVVSGEQGVFETCTGYLFHPAGTTPVFWSVAASGPLQLQVRFSIRPKPSMETLS